MKRRLVTICVCLLLGAIANVAVAWGCGFFQWQDQPVPIAESRRREALARLEPLPPGARGLHFARFASGFPLRSMEFYELTASHVKRVDGFWFRREYLPLRPIVAGFAINTVFCAAVLWLLFAAPGFIRRRVRIGRGQCGACGYPIAAGTGEVCSECGTPVSKR